MGSRGRSILVGWELGSGLGHLNALLAVLRRLAQSGDQVAFVVREVRFSNVVQREYPGCQLFLAPLRPPLGGPAGAPGASYADLLWRCGYGSVDVLAALVDEWNAILANVQPDLIVCDHSPTLVLVASARYPVVHIGTGFTVPPCGVPFKILYPPTAGGLEEREAQVLQSINAVGRTRGMATLEHVYDLWSNARSFPCVWPEIDPYSDVRRESAVGPLDPVMPVPVRRKDHFVFGYLAGEDATTTGIIQSLEAAQIRCGIFARGGGTASVLRHNSTVTLYDAPRPMPEAILAASAFLHHGGSTANVALAAGRPQFIVPRNLDQLLVALAIQHLGCGISLHTAPAAAGTHIRTALESSAYLERASQIAANIAARKTKPVLPAVVSACEEILNR